MTLSWNDRITMLSVNPDAASRDDVARLAADLMTARADNERLRAVVEAAIRLRKAKDAPRDELFAAWFDLDGAVDNYNGNVGGERAEEEP